MTIASVSLRLSPDQYRCILKALQTVDVDARDPALKDAMAAMRQPRMAASDAQDTAELLAEHMQAGVDLIVRAETVPADVREWAEVGQEMLEAYFEVPERGSAPDASPTPS
jgi:hypothetical protein